MNNKTKKLIAVLLVVAQVLTCNAGQIFARDINKMSFLMHDNDGANKNYNEELLGSKAPEEVVSEDISSLDFNVDDSNVYKYDITDTIIKDDDIVNTTNNKNNYEEEPESDEEDTDLALDDEKNSYNENNDEQKINIEANTTEKESESSDKESAGVNKETEVDTRIVDVEASISDAEETNEIDNNIGVNKESDIDVQKVSIIATTSEVEGEFVFADDEVIGVDAKGDPLPFSDYKDKVDELEIATDSVLQILLGDEDISKKSSVIAIFGDVGYVPEYHANYGYLGYKNDDGKWGTDKLKRGTYNKKQPKPSTNEVVNWYVSEDSKNFDTADIREFLNKNQNIRGYIYDEKTDSMELIEGVKFNNDWAIDSKPNDCHYHIEEDDDDYDKDQANKYTEAYYGMYFRYASDINLRAVSDNNGWKDGKGSYTIFGSIDLEWLKKIVAPQNDKGIYYNDDYEFYGWTPSIHNITEINGRYCDVGALNYNMLKSVSKPMITGPGKSFAESINKYTNKHYVLYHFPLSYGPFYRSYTSGNPNKKKDYLSTNYREGWRHGLADKGLIYQRGSGNTTYGFVRVDRHWDDRDELDNGGKAKDGRSIKYAVLFFSPVFVTKGIKITYETNGGTFKEGYNKPERYKETGAATTLPTSNDISRTGYTFKGWYYVYNGDVFVTSLGANEYSKNINKVFASWEPNTYTIQTKANTIKTSDGVTRGKTSDSSSVNAKYNEEFTTESGMDIEGCTFLGFATTLTNPTKYFAQGTTYKVSEIVDPSSTGTTCLYPIWVENEYTMEINGGQITNSDNSTVRSSNYTTTTKKDNQSKFITVKYYEKFNFPKEGATDANNKKLSITGSNLQGFATSINGDVVVEPGAQKTVQDLKNVFSTTDTTKFYGIWKEKAYDIRFKVGNATGTDGVTRKSASITDNAVTDTDVQGLRRYKYYQRLIIPNNANIEGFDLVGYNQANGKKQATKGFEKGKTIDQVGQYANILKEATSDEPNYDTDEGNNIFYGAYKEKDITVNYYGGSKKASNEQFISSNASSSITYKYYQTVKDMPDLTLTGFNFIGFSKNKQQNLPTYINNKTVEGDSIVAHDLTKTTTDLYAVWKEKEYAFEFNYGKGIENTTETKLYYGKIKMPEVDNVGDYKLIGFSRKENQTEPDYETKTLFDIKSIIEDYNEDTEVNIVEKKDDTDTNVLYGVWEKQALKVNLDANTGLFENDESVLDIITSEESAKLSDFTGYKEPYKSEDYVFLGWRKVGGDDTIITKDTEIDSSMNLIAVWGDAVTKDEIVIDKEKDSYTVRIDNDKEKGSVGDVEFFEIKVGDFILQTLEDKGIIASASEGYRFIGWSYPTDTDNSYDFISVADTYSLEKGRVIKTIYNSANEITVLLKANSGIFISNKQRTKTISNNTNKFLPLNEIKDYEEPVKSGDYEFLRWEDEEKNVISKDTIIKTDNIVLTAIYKDKINDTEIGFITEDNTDATYTIFIKTDDSISTYEGNEVFEIKKNENIKQVMEANNISSPSITNDEYEFVGWTFEENGSNCITDEDVYNNTGKTVLYAKYSKKNINYIELDANTGIFEKAKTTTISLEIENEAILNEIDGYETPIKSEGFEFLRWETKEGEKYYATSSIVSSVKLLAIYKNKKDNDKEVGTTDTETQHGQDNATYTILIQNDDSKGNVGEKTSFEIKDKENVYSALKKASISTPVPSDNYRFYGWSFSGNFDDVIKEDTLYSLDKGRYLTAIYFNKNIITVTLNANSGLFDDNKRELVLRNNTNDFIQLSQFEGYKKPFKTEDYEFVSWKDEKSNIVKETDLIIKDIVLTAVYKNKKTDEDIDINYEKDANAKYTIKILNDNNKGTISEPTKFEIQLGQNVKQVMKENKISSPSLVKGYGFSGWSWSSSDEDIIDDETIYNNKNLTTLTTIYYDANERKIILNANTGLFKDGSRKKLITTIGKNILNTIDGYEEPFKSEKYRFDRWETKGSTIEIVASNSMIKKDIELFAVYKNEFNNDVGSEENTQEGGKDAWYTIKLYSDPEYGTIKGQTLFEIQKDTNVLQRMSDLEINNPEVNAGWYFAGWSFTNDIANRLKKDTVFNTNWTVLYATYYKEGEITVSLNANTGLFKDNTRTRKLTLNHPAPLTSFNNYDTPFKSAGYSFYKWITLEGQEIDLEKDIDKNMDLLATYKGPNNEIIGTGSTNYQNDNATFTVLLDIDSTKGSLLGPTSFEIRKGENILATMSYAGIKEPRGYDDNYFAGWTLVENSFADIVSRDAVFVDTITKLYAMWTNETRTVVLKANTGLFSDNLRQKTLYNVPYMRKLNSIMEYERPIKTKHVFKRWVKEGTNLTIDEDELITEDLVLVALYEKDGKEIGFDEETKDGGDKAIYTVRILNSKVKGNYTGSETFDIELNQNVMEAMKANGVIEPIPTSTFLFAGWSFEGSISKLVKTDTIYENINFTAINSIYSSQTLGRKITFDATLGRFEDGNKIKVFNGVANGRILNTMVGYEEPSRKGWKFLKWENENGDYISSSSQITGPLTLNAVYLDKYEDIVSYTSHSHLDCGEEVCSHDTSVIGGHEQAPYLPVVSVDEILQYILEEEAKDVHERNPIYLYLDDNITSNTTIELDTNIDLHLCLNGFSITAGNIKAKEGAERANVYITNCRNTEVSYTLNNENNNTMFENVGLYVYGREEGYINLKTNKPLVYVSAENKEDQKIEIMFANITQIDNTKTIENLITAQNKSTIVLQDVQFNGINVDNSIVNLDTDGQLTINSAVRIKDIKTQKSVLILDGSLIITSEGGLFFDDITIEKGQDGNYVVVVINNPYNLIEGSFSLENAGLVLTNDYLSEIKPIINEEKTTVEENIDDLVIDISDEIFNSSSEDVDNSENKKDRGYVAALEVGEKASITVGDAYIKINENHSFNDKFEEAYMHQVIAKGNKKAVFEQLYNTKLDEDSDIGIAFDTEDGEGTIIDNTEIADTIFTNQRYGIDQKLLKIEEDEHDGLKMSRKVYYVEYNEGKPTTNESKTVIDTYLNGATVSEITRIKSQPIKAGHNYNLGRINYKAKGFEPTNYNVNNKTLEVAATVSYIDDVYDGEDIVDGQVFVVDTNWKENNLSSEAKELIVTEELYNQIITQQAEEISEKIASQTMATKVKEVEEIYYTVFYYLEGGHMDGEEPPLEGYVEVNNINAKDNYVLLNTVVSGNDNEDFIGWEEDKDSDNKYVSNQIIKAGTIKENDEVVHLYARYAPSTYKIKYNLDGGYIEGHENEEELEDTIIRKADYKLLTDVKKLGGYVFKGWSLVGDDEILENVIKGNSLTKDLEVVARFDSNLYDFTYHLMGGSIDGATDVVDDVWTTKIDLTEPYTLVDDVKKKGFNFNGWKTSNNKYVKEVTIANIKNINEVWADYKNNSYTINYDVGEGEIVGFNSDSKSVIVEVGTDYIPFTDIQREGWTFDGWIDAKTKQPVTKITNAKVGEVYNLVAKYYANSYTIKLHLNGGKLPSSDNTDIYEINVDSRNDYVLPTDIEKEDWELYEWYYLNSKNEEVSISTIKKGNENNITDVYARYNSLLTNIFIYHLNEDEEIKNAKYDEVPEKGDAKTVSVLANKRNTYYYYQDVTKKQTEYEQFKFVGWLESKHSAGSLDSVLDNVYFETVSPGVSRELEEFVGVEAKEYITNLYPYFSVYNKPTFTIKYDLDGGTLLDRDLDSDGTYTDTALQGIDYFLLTTAYKEGFEFQGWYNGDKKIEKINATDTKYPEKVKASWKKVKFNLKYYVNGGTMPGKALSENNTVYATTFINNSKIDLETNVTREGYRFLGWFDKNKLTNKIDYISAGTDKDVEVVAKWDKYLYKVTYILDGGKIEGKPENTFVETYDKTQELILPTEVTKEGHLFIGWFATENGTEVQYEKISATEGERNDITLTARFKDITYTVTYILKGGSIKGKALNKDGNLVETYYNTEAVTLFNKDSIIAPANFAFIGWEDQNNNTITTIPINNNEDIVVTAKYQSVLKTLAYVLDEGIIEGKVKTNGKVNVTYNSAEKLVLDTSAVWPQFHPLDKTGTKRLYFFDGWYTDRNYKEEIKEIPAGNPNNIQEVYAKWTYGAYSIVYFLNGGKIDNMVRIDPLDMTPDAWNANSEYILPTKVNKDNGKFLGWYDNPEFNGSPVTVIPKNPKLKFQINSLTGEPNEGGYLEFYAKWDVTHYSVVFNKGQGNFVSDNSKNQKKYVVDKRMHYVLDEVVEKPNYAFDGWFTRSPDLYPDQEEIIYLPNNYDKDISVVPKLVKLNNLSDEELEKLENRKQQRQAKIQEINAIIEKEVKNIAESEKAKSQNVEAVVSILAEEVVGQEQSSNSTVTNAKEPVYSQSSSLLGAINEGIGNMIEGVKNILLGDDDEGAKEEDTKEEDTTQDAEVSLSNLHAYDTMSADNLGLEVPKDTVFNGAIITYIIDKDGNNILDYNYLGTTVKPGENLLGLSELYDKVGFRAVFIDKTLMPEEKNNGVVRPAQPGGGRSGGIVKPMGDGTVSGGVMTALDDDNVGAGNVLIEAGKGIVNPYGYDGRGDDNGAFKAIFNTNNLLEAITDYKNYTHIDLSKVTEEDVKSLGDGYFEYFPASNGYKYFFLDKMGHRSYIKNGWHKLPTSIGEKWFRFDNDGMMMSGFIYDNGKVYYLRNTLDGVPYMMTGFVEWKKAGLIAHFRTDGELDFIFENKDKLKYVNEVNSIPKDSLNHEYLHILVDTDNKTNILDKTIKTTGTTSLGNFVGYWYYLKDGRRRFRFETIDNNLVMSKYAKSGWLNIYDKTGKEASYKFASNGNLITNNLTDDGHIVDDTGAISNPADGITKLAITKEGKENTLKGVELDTKSEVKLDSNNIKSWLVSEHGIVLNHTKATRLYTEVKVSNDELVALNQSAVIPTLTN